MYSECSLEQREMAACFIDRINVAGTDQNIPVEIFVEDTPITEIANAFNEGNDVTQFSYDDMLNFFGLSSKTYTRQNFKELVDQLSGENTDKTHYVLQDSLPDFIRNRRFIEDTDISPAALCAVSEEMDMTNSYSFSMSIGNIAANNAEQGITSKAYFLDRYLTGVIGMFELDCSESDFGGCEFNLGCFDFTVDTNVQALIAAILEDRDPVRRAEAISNFSRCADIERDRKCLDGYSEAREIKNGPGCDNLKYDIACYKTTLIDLNQKVGSSPYHIDRESTRKEVSMTLPKRTERYVEWVLQKWNVLPETISRVLEVGPGLDIVPLRENGSLRCPSNGTTHNGQQTYEPLAFIKMLEDRGINIDQLRFDVLDINPRPIRHLTKAVENARLGLPYIVHDMDLFGWDEEHSPRLVLPLNPIMGDIVTDKIADEGTYDVIIMLNVFMYLNGNERILALDNISRLLKKGGVLLTDVYLTLGDRGKLVEVNGEDPDVYGHWPPSYTPTASNLDCSGKFERKFNVVVGPDFTGPQNRLVIWKKE